MSYAGFIRCDRVTMLPQNDGQGFHVTPGDSGGATIDGITFHIFVAWRVSRGMPEPTIDDFKAAPASELTDLRHAWFWMAVAGDRLPIGVDLVAYEIGFGSGAGWAARLLKRALRMPEDNRMDGDVIRAAQTANAIGLIKSYSAVHMAFVNSLDGAHLFGRGWDRRVVSDEATALLWQGQDGTHGA